MKLTIEGLNMAISNKPAGFNLWVIDAYNMRKQFNETRTFSEFYTSFMFAFTQWTHK